MMCAVGAALFGHRICANANLPFYEPGLAVGIALGDCMPSTPLDWILNCYVTRICGRVCNIRGTATETAHK